MLIRAVRFKHGGGYDEGVFEFRDLRYPDVIVAPSLLSQSEAIAWVREVNSRWIVHHGLRERAAAYLAHLEATGSGRLAVACERAVRLVGACPPTEDPKPWFYAGLFSVATAEEAQEYLADHWFTARCIPSLAGQAERRTPPRPIGPETLAKIARVRRAVSALD